MRRSQHPCQCGPAEPAADSATNVADEDHTEDVDVTMPYEGNVYSDFLPLYQQATAATLTIEDANDLKATLHSFTERALERTNQRVGTVPTSGMGSFASTDHRTRDTRLSANSPLRKRKRN